MWVRGLKQKCVVTVCECSMSHPMWVRGLKHFVGASCDTDKKVAPYVGAWIETSCCCANICDMKVAPYVGAWIETC